MYAHQRSETTVAVSASSGMSGNHGGTIEKVLVLNGDANSALGSLLYALDALIPDLHNQGVANNQIEALLDLRKAAYGY